MGRYRKPNYTKIYGPKYTTPSRSRIPCAGMTSREPGVVLGALADYIKENSSGILKKLVVEVDSSGIRLKTTNQWFAGGLIILDDGVLECTVNAAQRLLNGGLYSVTPALIQLADPELLDKLMKFVRVVFNSLVIEE